METKHPSHVTRSSDASTFDEVCVNCGATDIAPGGWGVLAYPCPNAQNESSRSPVGSTLIYDIINACASVMMHDEDVLEGSEPEHIYTREVLLEKLDKVLLSHGITKR